MLYLSLPPALLLVILSHVAARRAPHPVRWPAFLVLGAGLAFGTVCIGLALPPVMVLFLALAAALAAWPAARRRLPTFLPVSAGATLLAFGVVAWPALVAQAEYARLRDRFPFESMEGRAPSPRPEQHPGPVAWRLAAFEPEVETASQHTGRAYALQALHGDTVQLFVDSPGFGVSRMRMVQPTETLLTPKPREEPPVQPASPAPPGKYQAGTGHLPEAEVEALVGLHAGGVLDFVNPRGFGFVKDRGHVAGFQPHGFSQVPSSSKAWAVRRVELVGLLRHPDPVVYLSARLPAMDELKAAPTRPLDEFEAVGLAAVRRGEDIYAARTGAGVRFVGAIRSVKQCVGCHGGDRGDLLGAFSYMLAPEQ
ncbi:MAG: hypothetical protein JWO38_2280 [Gemmataceae bacterium]|nr:hypothetical protein [Gemmataceae bacterium]